MNTRHGSLPFLALMSGLWVAAVTGVTPSNARAEASAALDEATRTALERAIAEERGARGFYAAVVDRHGQIRPFVGILAAESKHEEELLALAERYGVTAPANMASTGFTVPDNVADACAAAAGRERESAASLAELLATASAGPVRDSLERLRAASAERHLPAFERCVQLGGALPQKEVPPPRCGSCDMVGCGCSQAAAAGVPAPEAPKKAGCGCQQARQ